MQTIRTIPTPDDAVADDLVAAMRGFILDQALGRTEATVARYEQVADELSVFIETVDVAPWLGRELATHLAAERERLGNNALLRALGLISLVRVLPAFLADPWLPSAGQQRRTHRVVVKHVSKFLRLQCMRQSCFRREDFVALDKSLRHSLSRDYGTTTRWAEGESDLITCTVTLALRERLIDALLDEVSHEQFESWGEAMAARLNPVPVTIWMEPDEAEDRALRWWRDQNSSASEPNRDRMS